MHFCINVQKKRLLLSQFIGWSIKFYNFFLFLHSNVNSNAKCVTINADIYWCYYFGNSLSFFTIIYLLVFDFGRPCSL